MDGAEHGAETDDISAIGSNRGIKGRACSRPCVDTQGDVGEVKVKKRDVVGCLLLPADQQPTGTIQPGVGALDDPATGFGTMTALLLRFLAATPDVG